jgi:signal transduction histidine kinase
MSRHFTELVRLNRRVDRLLPGNSGKEERFLRIHIRDNGPGIPPEVQDRIFVPFFTTKKTGTGIGLPIAQKIVHAHGGVLDMESEVGKGTEFIIKIPMRHSSGR